METTKKINGVKEARKNFNDMLKEVELYANSLLATHDEYVNVDVEIGKTDLTMGSMEFGINFRDTERIEPLSTIREWKVNGFALINTFSREVGIVCTGQYFTKKVLDCNGFVSAVKETF